VFLCLITVVKNLSTILNEIGDSGNLILFLVLEEMVSVFLHSFVGPQTKIIAAAAAAAADGT
jgi:hypothetical protein